MESGHELLRLQQTLYESRNPTRRWLHCTRRDWIIAAIQRYLPAGEKKALEIGPGSGVYLPVLASLFDRVTAMDIEDAYLDHAQRLADSYPNLTFLTDDITHSKLADGSFDLILCSEVIEHVPDPNAALQEMHRLLKPKGVLILSTPQRHSTLELVAKVAFMPGVVHWVKWVYREAVLEMGHISLMTEKQVRLRLKASGFYVIEHFKSGLYLPSSPSLREDWIAIGNMAGVQIAPLAHSEPPSMDSVFRCQGLSNLKEELNEYGSGRTGWGPIL
jgi:SAM-dependent methyltransferase